MSTIAAGEAFLLRQFGNALADIDISKDLSVQAALLDQFGVIVAVNDRWKEIADLGGFTLPNYGIGQNYLRHCAFADPLSPRLIRGLSRLLAGDMDRLSLIYSCGNTNPSSSFLLLAFPHPQRPSHIIVMHIDITVLITIFSVFQKEASADEAISEPAPVTTGVVTSSESALEQTLLATLGRNSAVGQQAAALPGRRFDGKDQRHPPLSKRQMEVLGLMAQGRTNAEIAQKLGLSLNTVKVYVSGILARLGLQSRAQVLHWALTRSSDES